MDIDFRESSFCYAGSVLELYQASGSFFIPCDDGAFL
jgi:hypothetical protein